MDWESLRYVAEDLQFLASWRGDIPDSDIRRGSATLRRLLVESTYDIAWRAAGFEREPSVIAVDLDNHMNPQHRADVVYALAGGAFFRGFFSAGHVVQKSRRPAPLDSGSAPPLRPDGYPGERLFKLSEFLGSRAGFVGGEYFTRRDVIKYVANVKGGVHLNERERKAETKLIDRVGKIDRKLVIHNTDALLVELVAIAQAIGTSEDARTFAARVLASGRADPGSLRHHPPHHASDVDPEAAVLAIANWMMPAESKLQPAQRWREATSAPHGAERVRSHSRRPPSPSPWPPARPSRSRTASAFTSRWSSSSSP